MATFKQINPFIGKVMNQKHIRHLSWMKRFDSRVGACVTELGQDVAVKVRHAYEALHAAVEHEDQVYLVIHLTSGMRHPKYFFRSNRGLMARCPSVRKRVWVSFC